MIVKHSKHFHKSYKLRIKPYPKIRKRFEERVKLFMKDPGNPILKDHKLVGKMRTFKAFSITGDIRVIYFQETELTAIFIDVGTHNQVYN